MMNDTIRYIIFAIFTVIAILSIFVAIGACVAAGRADEREEELFKEYKVKSTMEEFEAIKQKLLEGEISIDEYLDQYNELIDKEADRMQKASPVGPHEHI